MNFKPPRMPLTNSFRQTEEEMSLRAHKLKACVKCGYDTEPMGGVELRGKWHCAKCWIKFLNGGR